MIRAKTIADTLTVTRVLLALLIFCLGVTGGSEALPAATTALIFAWATDLLDGTFARRDPSPQPTWVGERDLHADVSVSVSVLAYLTFSRFVPLWASLIYVAITVVLLWHFRSRHLAMAMQAPPYALMLYTALRYATLQGAIAVAWILLTVIVTWPRFPKEVVPSFLHGMRNLGQPSEEEQ